MTCHCACVQSSCPRVVDPGHSWLPSECDMLVDDIACVPTLCMGMHSAQVSLSEPSGCMQARPSLGKPIPSLHSPADASVSSPSLRTAQDSGSSTKLCYTTFLRSIASSRAQPEGEIMLRRMPSSPVSACLRMPGTGRIDHRQLPCSVPAALNRPSAHSQGCICTMHWR